MRTSPGTGSAAGSTRTSSALVTWSAIRSPGAIIADKLPSAPANCPSETSVRRAEHPIEDGVDVCEMVIEVEQLGEFGGRHPRGDLMIGVEQVEKRQLAVAFPHSHRV